MEYDNYFIILVLSCCSKMWYVYILKCSDNTYYTGCTYNLDERISQHARGGNRYTKERLPVELVTYIAFDNKYKAYDFERYLKSGSGKAFAFKRFINKY